MFKSGLYLVTPSGWVIESLLEVLEEALKAGVSVVQYRDKQCAVDQMEDQARRIVELSHRYSTPCIINDSFELAAKVGADGVHLGRDDGEYLLARKLLGQSKWIGLSCYGDSGLISKAIALGADYVGVGSIFASLTKPLAPAIGLDSLASLVDYANQFAMPVIAIGGINQGNIDLIYRSGVHGAAVISSVFDSKNISQAIKIMSK